MDDKPDTPEPGKQAQQPDEEELEDLEAPVESQQEVAVEPAA
jgi:hypothetical protein